MLLGDLGEADRMRPSAWDDALASVAWERWLLGGRLAALRAELELEEGRFEDAMTWFIGTRG